MKNDVGQICVVVVFLVESREFGPHVRHVRFVSSCWVSPFCFSKWSSSKSSSRKITSILLLVDSFILSVQASTFVGRHSALDDAIEIVSMVVDEATKSRMASEFAGMVH